MVSKGNLTFDFVRRIHRSSLVAKKAGQSYTHRFPKQALATKVWMVVVPNMIPSEMQVRLITVPACCNNESGQNNKESGQNH